MAAVRININKHKTQALIKACNSVTMLSDMVYSNHPLLSKNDDLINNHLGEKTLRQPKNIIFLSTWSNVKHIISLDSFTEAHFINVIVHDLHPGLLLDIQA